jgi:hypothetical protein
MKPARAKRTEQTDARERTGGRPAGNQAVVLEALAELTNAGGLVSESALRAATVDRGVEKSAAWHALRALIQSGALVSISGFVRLADEEDGV